MALLFSPNCEICYEPYSPTNPNFKLNQSKSALSFSERRTSLSSSNNVFSNSNLFFDESRYNSFLRRRRVLCSSGEDPSQSGSEDNEVNDLGVKAALSMLKFYKREISPLLPKSCRYVPTCSEYSMIAYKKYGVVKGSILTAWRLCRCNPLGGSGFDPPRWFDEPTPPQQ